MKITEEFKKLKELYSTNNFNSNNMLRMNFTYQGNRSFILYQNSPELENNLIVFWETTEGYIPISYFIKLIKNEYYFHPYIKNSIYKYLVNLFPHQGDLTKFFTYVFSQIKSTPIESEPKNNINQYYKNIREVKDNIYFWYVKRGNMSIKMAEKLSEYYNDDIVNFLKKYTHTCAFTDDINKAKDLKLEIFNSKKLPKYAF